VKGKLQGLLVAGAVVLLGGCAAQGHLEFSKADITQQGFTQDKAACQVESQYVQVADYAYRGTFMEGVNIQQKQNQTFVLCMTSKGYSSRMVQ